MTARWRTLTWAVAALLAGCVSSDKFKDDALGDGGRADARVAAADAAPPAGDAAPSPDAGAPDVGAASDDAAPDAVPARDAAPPGDAGSDAAPPPDAAGADAAPPPADAAPAGPCQVRFVAQLPAGTPAEDDIYVAGSAWDWDPGSPTLRMTRIAGGQAELIAPLDPGVQLEYKYTRGDWTRVERNADCGERANRGAFVQCGPDGEQVLRDVVERWVDIDCGG